MRCAMAWWPVVVFGCGLSRAVGFIFFAMRWAMFASTFFALLLATAASLRGAKTFLPWVVTQTVRFWKTRSFIATSRLLEECGSFDQSSKRAPAATRRLDHS